MMMVIMDFTGFPTSAGAAQFRSPEFSFEARFRVLFAQCGAKRTKSKITQRNQRKTSRGGIIRSAAEIGRL